MRAPSLGVVVSLLCSSGVGLGISQADATSTAVVHGGWLGELPCAFTSVGATPPSTGVTFSCTSGTTWDGDWTGHTRYVVTGSTDPSSGDVSGTIDETFTGIDTSSRSPGTIHLLGGLTVSSATDTIVVTERIADASGAFAGYRGDLVFEGVQVSGAVGHGGYHGSIKPP